MNGIDLSPLASLISGTLFTDDLHKIIYATDASVYREVPLGVVYPRDEKDVVQIVKYCAKQKISLIPRAAGTSLAGQCVGNGLVMDVSKYMTKIISIDHDNKTVTLQPGVIRDDANHALRSYGLMIGPNTSTANRAMMGGMVGNNSCGSTSIVFGNTRDHVKSLRTVLSDGSVTEFGDLTQAQFREKCKLNSLEGNIYRKVNKILSDSELCEEIVAQFPKSSISRRNTGYAIDELMNSEVFSDYDRQVNLCNLLCGSEGTLALTTEITIGLVDIPPPHEVLVAIHFDSVGASLQSVPTIMNHAPFACELMDKTILDCTKGQILYEPDRFFLEGDPEAVMLVSFVSDSITEASQSIDSLIEDLKRESHGYSFPVIKENIDKVWNLRKAGLGLLANLPGDKKAVACIEDTAVAIEDLAAYISEFSEIMDKHNQKSVYYAHAGAGEIHLRPILDLKQKEDRVLFQEISQESAHLVKKYKGSLSGEHGDGRVRAPFIQDMVGQRIYNVFREIKLTWDPDQIFNPGKIVDAAPIDSYLRFDEDHQERDYETTFDFSETGGLLRAAEKCNGSGDCRKTVLAGGTMCPSYMATRDEKDTTRARANTLREVLTRPNGVNPWNNKELKDVLDLCLSCKGCTAECPSNVDMSSMKAEFMDQYQKINGIPFRSKVFANFNKLSKIGSSIAAMSNFALSNSITGGVIKRALGVHPKRSMPKIARRTFMDRYNKSYNENSSKCIKSIYLFCDEFTNYNDAEIGETSIKLLSTLGYNIKMIEHSESGRAALSKGVLSLAKDAANKNVEIFSNLITADTPLIGIEPSAILTFRDEYPRLVNDDLVSKANHLKKHTYTIEEFLYNEVKVGNINSKQFDSTSRKLLLHGHCHQKALSDINESAWLLSIPKGNTVEIIPSGCCGMAGSFGYEHEHYDLSMQIGELVLLPAVRNKSDNAMVVASGTSCRHQIYDGANAKSYHPVEILYNSLLKD